MKDLAEKIREIGERWFLTEPLLFSVFCSHTFRENKNLRVPFRVGNHTIEFSSEALNRVAGTEKMTDAEIQMLLTVEMLRILLKHPYRRPPDNVQRDALSIASNITIADISPRNFGLMQTLDFFQKFFGRLDYNFPENLSFEEYYALLCQNLEQERKLFDGDDENPGDKSSEIQSSGGKSNPKNSEDNRLEELRKARKFCRKEGFPGALSMSDDDVMDLYECGKAFGDVQENENLPEFNWKERNEANKQLSELWKEDEMETLQIDELIENAESSDSWGTLGGVFRERILANQRIDLDYRKMLSLFRMTILSSQKFLTRMRPSRRFGFLSMGSRYALTTNLLVAVDVSGSVSDKSLSQFFSIINRFFKYGMEKIDVIQFDTELKSPKPVSLKKAKSEVKIIGRGGTNFQPAADFYCSHPEYDGLIYFTDGIAPPPCFKAKRRINVLWVLTGKREYEKSLEWIRNLRHNRAVYIPVPGSH